MDPAFEVSVNGLNMEFTIHLAADGCSIPDLLFCGHFKRKMPTLTSTHMVIQGLFDVG